MRIKALLAGAALATTGLIGAGASTASAGCGITLEFHNPGSVGSLVDLDESDVCTMSGFWKRLGSGSVWVGAGDTVFWNFTADFGCGLARQYRIDVNQGGSSWYEYEPNLNWYTTDTTPHVHVD